MNTPRNIIAIDRIQAGSIIGLHRIDESSVAVSPLTSWVSLPIKVPARLTVNEKIEDGVRLYTAQLVFRTCKEPDDMRRMVYRCKTADGKYLLIGSNDRPYPVSTLGINLPDNVTDSQLDEITVNYTSTAQIPYIL